MKRTNIVNILGPLEGQDPKKEYPYLGRGEGCQRLMQFWIIYVFQVPRNIFFMKLFRINWQVNYCIKLTKINSFKDKYLGVDVDKWDYFLRDNNSLKIGITFDHHRYKGYALRIYIIHSHLRFLKNITLADWPFFAAGKQDYKYNNHTCLDKDKLTVKRIAIRDKEFDNCQVLSVGFIKQLFSLVLA